MTDIDAIHVRLDAQPDDHTARLVLADVLDEQGDPRAAGYRALGLGLPAWTSPRAQIRDTGEWAGRFRWQVDVPGVCHTVGGATRREAEDAAALAFAKLPPELRAELLGTA